MAERHLKRPRDPIQLGKLIVDIATGQIEDRAPAQEESPGARITPAMAAGVTTTLWSLADMVRVIEEWEMLPKAA